MEHFPSTMQVFTVSVDQHTIWCHDEKLFHSYWPHLDILSYQAITIRNFCGQVISFKVELQANLSNLVHPKCIVFHTKNFKEHIAQQTLQRYGKLSEIFLVSATFPRTNPFIFSSITFFRCRAIETIEKIFNFIEDIKIISNSFFFILMKLHKFEKEKIKKHEKIRDNFREW